MKRTLIQPDLSQFPSEFQSLLQSHPVFDSSCSQAARVWFLDVEGGLYLKSAPSGTLRSEADMTRYFHSKGLSAEVLAYLPRERDWLLTRAVPGEDCLFPAYLEHPRQLCDTIAELLRMLHETSFADCPVTNRCEIYRTTAEQNYCRGHFDSSLFPEDWGFRSAKEAWQVIQTNAGFLQADTLLHGDYCLPNIMLDNWRFSGFIDLGNAGVGDKHIDLFWGLWTLNYNLKTNAYYDRFLDAYGRENVEPELLRTVAALEEFL